MPGPWYRFEAAARSIPLRDGLAARVADPLWALARQHQVGEFRGDDAAQPAAVKVAGRTIPLQSFRGSGKGPPATLLDEPLEARVERMREPDYGGASLFASVRAGSRLERLLRAEGFGAAAAALQESYGVAKGSAGNPNSGQDGPSGDGVIVDGAVGRAAADLLRRRGLDGYRLSRGTRTKVIGLMTKALDAEGIDQNEINRAIELFDEWKEGLASLAGAPDSSSWDHERLEHRFSVAAAGPKGEVLLSAPEHWGGHLDWYSFDINRNSELAHKLKRSPANPLQSTHLPTSVRYSGMPASRWWEFEDNAVHFGDLEAGPGDLARLLVAEFATVYSDDWFVIPLKVPVSCLAEIASVEVIDNFDEPVTLTSLAASDAAPGKPRPWRFFELTGDVLDADHPAPWLFIPPSVISTVEGPALERVAFSRDEGANLAWGIERLVEGPLGRGVDRSRAWAAAHPPVSTVAPKAASSHPVSPTDAEERWRYRLEATAPPWWIPLMPERIRSNSAQVKLRRSRMENWTRLTGEGIGPHSDVLDPRRPVWVREEEVPRSGIRLERRWQLTRWHDGSLHVWLQRRKRPGRGEASSGVKWDLLEDE